ncbi:MAG: DNA-methyltransferase [Gammaproteobacteria bacterium]
MPSTKIVTGDCLHCLGHLTQQIDLTFCDPPFNQGHFYRYFNDKQEEHSYWHWLSEVLSAVRAKTTVGGMIYFMHREKNAEFALSSLRHAGWTFQNLIIWKKMTSAVPAKNRYGKHYQIIISATNGEKAQVFNKLRIDPPIAPNHHQARKNGIYVTDVWDDIRELTSGYFAGTEPVRTNNGERFHKQQSPIALLLRIILSSSGAGDLVFDPFAGTGTTLVVANQLNRQSIGVDLDPQNTQCIHKRLNDLRDCDCVEKFFNYYRYTQDIDKIWGKSHLMIDQTHRSVFLENAS